MVKNSHVFQRDSNALTWVDRKLTGIIHKSSTHLNKEQISCGIYVRKDQEKNKCMDYGKT